MIKKTFSFIFIFLLFSISSIIFKINNNLEQFNSLFFYTIWFISNILISLSIFKIIKDFDINNDYLFILIINYLFGLLTSLFFTYYNNLNISVVCSCVYFISAIFLFKETKKIDKVSSYILIPYLLWNTYFTFSLINIFLIN